MLNVTFICTKTVFLYLPQKVCQKMCMKSQVVVSVLIMETSADLLGIRCISLYSGSSESVGTFMIIL